MSRESGYIYRNVNIIPRTCQALDHITAIHSSYASSRALWDVHKSLINALNAYHFATAASDAFQMT